MAKWEYKVVPIKTKIRSDHFEGSQKPVLEDVQSDLNLLHNVSEFQRTTLR